MRNTRWLRFGLASLTLVSVGLGGLLVACSDDDTDNGTITPTPDSGGGGTDSGPGTDAGTDTGTDAAPKPVNAKLTVVNAATDLGPQANVGTAAFQGVRICFALGAAAETAQLSPLKPQPDKSATALPPGLYIGTGGALPSYGLDLQDLVVVPYLMNVAALAAHGFTATTQTTCDEIFKPTFTFDGGAELTAGVDYWKLDAIPAKTFNHDKSYMLILSGCADNASVTPAAKCGPNKDGSAFEPSGEPGNGNLAANIIEVDRATAIASDAIGAQFIHASSAGAAILAASTPPVPVMPAFTATPADPTAAKLFTTANGGVVTLGQKTELAQIKGVTVAADSFTIQPAAANFAVKLTDIATATFPSGVPTGAEYANGKAFTFIAVGDPTNLPAAGNPRTFHYLAFPSDPTIVTYTP